MTTPQTLAKVSNPITWTVQYKSEWGDEWSANDTHLMPTEVQFALAPTMPRATLVRHLGLTSRLGIEETIVEPFDLTGKYVKITLNYVDEDEYTQTKAWYGYCPDPVDNYEGTRTEDATEITTGMTTYNCYGLEWFLRDTVVTTSIVYDPSISTGDLGCARSIPFNFSQRNRYDRTLGNRSASKNASGVYEFNPEESEEWTGKDVVEHLLENWYRATGWKFKFDLVNDAADELANITGSWNFQNYNYYNAIFEIINPSNAFTFAVTVNELTDKANIQVFPTVSEDLKDELGNTIVSALPVKFNMVLDSDSKIADGGARLQYLASNSYDKIEVRGDWLRVAFTLSGQTAWGYAKTLDDGWDLSDVIAYNTATDAQRLTDDHKAIFGRLILPTDFDGFLEDNPITSALAFPSIDTDTGDLDLLQPQVVYLKNRIFDRNLPWTEIDDESQPRQPFLVFQDSTNYWHYIDKPGTSQDGSTEFTPLGLQILDDQLGVQIVHGSNLNHLSGKNVFNGSSETEAEWDYRTSLVTVSMRTDEKVRVVLDSSQAEPGELTRTKIIEMPQYGLWWIAPGTVKSIDTSQSGLDGLVKVGEVGEYARNDSPKLLRAAILAKELYGRTRQLLSVTYESMFVEDILGLFVQEVVAGQTTQEVNTIISDQTFTFEQNTQRLNVKTSFFEFSLNRILNNKASSQSAKMPASGSNSGVFGNASNEDLANIPISFPGTKAREKAIFKSSYDADNQQHVISWPQQYCRMLDRQFGYSLISAGEIRIDSTASLPSVIYIYLVDAQSLIPTFFWEDGGTATSANSDTEDRRFDSTPTAQNIMRYSFDSATTPYVALEPNAQPVTFGKYRHSWIYRKSLTILSLPKGLGYVDAPPSNITLGNNFNSQLIAGWTTTNTIRYNTLANAGLYAAYVTIGNAKTDASGNLKNLQLDDFSTSDKTAGPTANISYTRPGGSTGIIYVVNGKVMTWT